MSKLKIGYVPNSGDMRHPADRRRLVYWARKRGHEIIQDLDQKHDVLFLSSRTDLTTWTERKNFTPLILDIVDGYLGEEHLLRDWVRGAGKVIIGHNSGALRPYRKIVSEACELAQAVVCSTVEQAETIIPYCANTHSILDFHEEFPMLPFNREVKTENSPALMWEGLPFTAKGLLLLEDPIFRIAKLRRISLEVVTDLKYPLLLGQYFYRNTEEILQTIPRKLGTNFRMTEWKLEAVVESAKRSHIAVLPLDPAGSLNPLKPENRLLMMWRMGLSTLTSPSLAYERVMRATLIDGICTNSEDWYARISELADSVDKRQESVERGQQYIRDTHSEEMLLRAWDKLFESVF